MSWFNIETHEKQTIFLIGTSNHWIRYHLSKVAERLKYVLRIWKKKQWISCISSCSVNICRAGWKCALPGTHQIDLSWFFTCANTLNFFFYWVNFCWDQTFINNPKLWLNLVGFVLYLHSLQAKTKDYKSWS